MSMTTIDAPDRAQHPSPFLRNAWYMAGWVSELPKEGLIPVSLLGEPIVLYRQETGAWAALEDMCCHRLVPLSLGRREKNDLRCMYHGLKFAPDGRCVEIPGQRRISPAIRVRSYPVAERHGGIWVWMGNPDRADVSEIPPIVGSDDPDFAVANASVDIEGEASLIWDNLLDLTHIPFLHENSFGGGDAATIATMLAGETEKLTMQVTSRGIHTERWHLNKLSRQGSERRDEFVSSDFVAPGVLIIRTESYKPGVGTRRATAISDEELLSVRVACQVVTPLSDTRSKIFFNIGISAGEAAAVPALLQLARTALGEDKLFIDAQQTMMRRMPDRKPMTLSMDVSIVRFAAVMRRLRGEECAVSNNITEAGSAAAMPA